MPWGERKPVTEYDRFVNKRRFGSSAERSLIATIIPKKIGHINTVISTTFKSTKLLVLFNGLCASLVYDFYLKCTGRGDLYESSLRQFPIVEDERLSLRILSLTSITNHYSDIWTNCWHDAFNDEEWTKFDPRLSNDFFKNLTKDWYRDCALRTDYARRQALVEIDVLAAMALGLTLQELKTIFRIQFPVLQAYEADTFYDQKGRIVFTANRGLTGVGVTRLEWKEIKDKTSGTFDKKIIDNTLPGDPIERIITFHAPFDACNREADYDTAWKAFEKRLGR